MTEWANIGLQELLDSDQRPSLVIDLNSPQDTPQVCYRNASFTTKCDLDDSLDFYETHETRGFHSWAFSPASTTLQPLLHYSGLTWVRNTLRGRYRLIQATSLTPKRPKDAHAADFSSTSSLGVADATFDRLKEFRTGDLNHDWTLTSMPSSISPHVQLLREWDWAKTPLGSLDSWPPLLRLMANLVVVDPSPVSLPATESAGALTLTIT
jgi:hypothetical protein